MFQNYQVTTTTTTNRRTPWHRRGLAVAIVAAAAMVSACGSSDTKANGVASVDEADGNTTDDTSADEGGADEGGADEGSNSGAGTAADAEAADELVWADYDQCMTDEGVEMPDFEETGGNELEETSESESELSDIDFDAFEAANEVCAPILDDLSDGTDFISDMSPEQKAAFDDLLVEMENCLADKGFDFPLTDSGGNALDGSDVSEVTFPEDMDWEAFDQAGTECEEQIEIPEILADLPEFAEE